MALFQGTIQSKSLGMQTGLTVFLPDDRSGPPKQALYLLHGLTDGCASWLSNSRVCLHAQAHRAAVIMPECHRSFYLDIPHGPSYFRYVSRELPSLCRRLFRLEGLPALIAGNSMGGFGAIRCFLAAPKQYAACFAFSPVISIGEFLPLSARVGMPVDPVSLSRDGRLPPEADLRASVPPVWEGAPLRFCCGREDFLYPQNAAFDRWLTERGIPHQFQGDKGAHEWDYWDAHLARALAYIHGEGLSSPEAPKSPPGN